MAKSIKKRTKGSAGRERRAATPQQAPDQGSLSKGRPGTKQSTAVEMLRSPSGATIDALMKATGWQQHSVRGFLAGAVRKRLKLKLDSAVVDGIRIYRITDEDGGKRPAPRTGRRKS